MTLEQHLHKKRLNRASCLRKNFGISLEDFDAIILAQGGVCAVCRQPFRHKRHPHVDHCHTTGKIRGVLCSQCNTGIGMLRESALIMHSAIAYLDRYNETLTK